MFALAMELPNGELETLAFTYETEEEATEVAAAMMAISKHSIIEVVQIENA